MESCRPRVQGAVSDSTLSEGPGDPTGDGILAFRKYKPAKTIEIIMIARITKVDSIIVNAIIGRRVVSRQGGLLMDSQMTLNLEFFQFKIVS